MLCGTPLSVPAVAACRSRPLRSRTHTCARTSDYTLPSVVPAQQRAQHANVLPAATPLCGGTLRTVHIRVALAGRDADVVVRAWTPPGPAPPRGWPVVFLNDGQNLFESSHSLSGHSWNAAEAASSCAASGATPPFAVVGIDNSGALRSLDYLPLVPGTGRGGFRPEAATWPGGGLLQYLDALADVVFPTCAALFDVTTDPERVAFGGSSFGAIAVLHCLVSRHRLCARFTRALIESPSLWIDDGGYLSRAALPAASHRGAWPSRTFLAMGGREHSGTRATGKDGGAAVESLRAADAIHSSSVLALVAALRKPEAAGGAGLGADRLRFVFDPEGAHNERDWARRLPAALSYLMAEGGRDADAQAAAAAAVSEAAAFVSFAPPAPPPTPEEAAAARHAAEAAAGAAAAEALATERHNSPGAAAAASAAAGALFFTRPSPLVAGAPFSLFVNRKALSGDGNLRDGARLSVVYGWDGWAACYGGPCSLPLLPAGLPITSAADWWAGAATGGGGAPPHAAELNFAITDGAGAWDNHGGHNHAAPVIDSATFAHSMSPTPLSAAVFGGGAASAFSSATAHSSQQHAGGAGVDGAAPHPPRPPRPPPRGIASTETRPLAGGTLHIVALAPRAVGPPRPGAEGAGGGGGDGGDAAARRAARWQEEKGLRAWTPPGWTGPESAPPGGYPVLYITDGQNVFEDATSHQGVSWRAAECAAHLIGSGLLPPFLIVAIDAAGAFRSLNYLPWPPGSGDGGFRPDCARWPGGGLDGYLSRLLTDVLPLAEAAFGASRLRERRAFGGASFAGVAALKAALSLPDVFGGVLAESPSLWSGSGAFLDVMRSHAGPIAERVWLGSGTREFSVGGRDLAGFEADAHRLDAKLAGYHAAAAQILAQKGVEGGKLAFRVDEGAGHIETAWAYRLHHALLHLFHGRM